MKYFFFLFSFISFAQQTPKVDFIKCNASVYPEMETKKVDGVVTYEFKVISAIDSIRIDAVNMTFSTVEINGKSVKFKNNNKELVLFEGFVKGKNKLKFIYQAFPKQTMYFNVGSNQIWTQGQGKYTSHWLPSFDDVNEKLVFNLNVTYDENYNVLVNGILKETFPDKDKKIWLYEMQKPMSSYLLAMVIGDFRNKVIASKSGIPLQFFIQPKDTAKFESTYRHSKKMFDYLEKEIGFKYPWQIYKQIPVEDFLYAGMENTSCTIFAQDFVVDDIGFNDRNYVNVNAHELAHQWFGDLVTAKSGKDHWLQEGFATYYALLAEREVFGDDYFYHQLYRTSLQLKNAAKTDTIPVMNEKASSLSFYQKGAWALHVIREAIGPKLFQKAVKTYLKKHQFKNVETDDFLAEIKKAAPAFDTEEFKKVWLEDYHFQTDEANVLLRKNAFMRTLFETQQLRKKSLAENRQKFSTLLETDVFYPVKTEILYQLAAVSFEDKAAFLTLAMQTNNVKVRQAVAEFTTEIPIAFKLQYESLLDDASYETKEIAFMNLWKNFPESRATYLAKAQNWIGGNDKSLRILFLTFSILSDEKESAEKTSYYNELVDYTSAKYESSVRQNAISNMLSINIKDTAVLKSLVNATTHHKWQFSKFGRDKIRQLMKDETIRGLFESLLPTLPETDKSQLQKLLNEKP
ncbi:M1 family metallopeptidase [Flavobacterium sp. 102]|uniref:M1 family metallopeptidase n=1 Tax=Flavobacterium sp. 102 TaxID=2135623 RepID=UPI000EAF15A7|nr:M1 family metallopeptidase [Flavobacterium sp. 102]RKS02075.1 aminopeptidase N [Flavobacterium sp. 102]